MTDTLYRSLEIGEATGRTLSGLAMPWDAPTRVRDLTGPAYMEAFAPGSADVSMRQHPSFPVFVNHAYRFDPLAEPLGVVIFQRSAAGLVYEAPLSKTARADEMLELIRDGAMRSVSIGFRPIHTTSRTLGRTNVAAYRTEVALRELSIAPTGMGQYAEAGIEAVRSTPGSFGDIQDAVEDAITNKLFGASGPGEGVYLYVTDIGPDWAVYSVEGGVLDKAIVGAQYQQVSYTTADDGSIELGDPTDVAKVWQPTGRSFPILESRQRRRARLAELPTF